MASKEFLIKLNEFLKNMNYIFLEKHHPIEKEMKNVQEFSNIKNISSVVEDIQDLLIHTDIMITDYSSTFIDFCLTGKPIIFYPYDYDEYSSKYLVHYDYFTELPGPFARTEDELFECIKDVDEFCTKKNYQEQYQELKNKWHQHKDGQSCKRLFNFLNLENC